MIQQWGDRGQEKKGTGGGCQLFDVDEETSMRRFKRPNRSSREEEGSQEDKKIHIKGWCTSGGGE